MDLNCQPVVNCKCQFIVKICYMVAVAKVETWEGDELRQHSECMKCKILAHPLFLRMQSKLLKIINPKCKIWSLELKPDINEFWKYLIVTVLHFVVGDIHQLWKLLIISLPVTPKHSAIQILFWGRYVLPFLYFLSCFLLFSFQKILSNFYFVIFLLGNSPKNLVY